MHVERLGEPVSGCLSTGYIVLGHGAGCKREFFENLAAGTGDFFNAELAEIAEGRGEEAEGISTQRARRARPSALRLRLEER